MLRCPLIHTGPHVVLYYYRTYENISMFLEFPHFEG